MRDNGTPTKLTTKLGGTPIYIADKPCTACGCFEAFVFACNCGKVHSDICYNCGRFVDMQHKSVEEMNAKWEAEFPGDPPPETRCAAGPVEHTHEKF